MEPSPRNSKLWAILWDLESAASALNARADELLDQSRRWDAAESGEPGERPRADWREVYDPDGPSTWSDEPSEPPDPRAIRERRRGRPATFSSQIKPDAPSDPLDLEPSEVTGTFRNVVYGIDTEAPAGRLRDLLDKRSFDKLWAESAGVDADTFATFFAEEGFGASS